MDNQRNRTKTDTGRRGEKPQALERMVVKELGKFTPYVRNKGALPPPLNRSRRVQFCHVESFVREETSTGIRFLDDCNRDVFIESDLMAGKGAEKRLWGLFIKNTALCQLARGCIQCDACSVPEC